MAKARKQATPPPSPKLTTVTIELASLRLDPDNARVHGKQNLQAIESSLRRFGQQKNIVVGKGNVVIAGNGAVLAARAIGWKTLEAFKTNLTAAEARAYALADNRTAELATWDYEVLAKTLADLQPSLDLSEIGWEPYQFEPLLAADWTPPQVESMPAVGETKHKITFSPEEWTVVSAAIARVRTKHKNAELTDGQCVALLCKKTRP